MGIPDQSGSSKTMMPDHPRLPWQRGHLPRHSACAYHCGMVAAVSATSTRSSTQRRRLLLRLLGSADIEWIGRRSSHRPDFTSGTNPGPASGCAVRSRWRRIPPTATTAADGNRRLPACPHLDPSSSSSAHGPGGRNQSGGDRLRHNAPFFNRRNGSDYLDLLQLRAKRPPSRTALGASLSVLRSRPCCCRDQWRPATRSPCSR